MRFSFFTILFIFMFLSSCKTGFQFQEKCIDDVYYWPYSREKTLSQETLNKHSDRTELNETIEFDSKYLGLYVVNNSDGGTQFFKFSKNNNNNELNIIYQDNLSVDLVIKTYQLRSFNEKSGEAILKNKKDLEKEIKVTFKKETKSENGYKLVDSKGIIYEFVGK